MLDRVQKQSETFKNYCTSIETQKVMLRRVMNSLHLDAIEKPSEKGSVTHGISGGLEMIDTTMGMRPPTQRDRVRKKR